MGVGLCCTTTTDRVDFPIILAAFERKSKSIGQFSGDDVRTVVLELAVVLVVDVVVVHMVRVALLVGVVVVP